MIDRGDLEPEIQDYNLYKSIKKLVNYQQNTQKH